MLGIIIRQIWLDLLPTRSDDLHSLIMSILCAFSKRYKVNSFLYNGLVFGFESENVDESSPLLRLAIG